MKFSIKQSVLVEQLTIAIKGVSTKNLIPILNCIKFSLTKDGLTLTSTDNEMVIITFINKDKIDSIEKTGEVVISGKYIYDMVKKLPNCIINIEEVADSKIFITTEKTEFSLNCNNVYDFPSLDMDYKEQPVVLKRKIFKDMINTTAFATSMQESRPTLTGINFILDKDKIEATATDSYRLSKKVINISGNHEYSNLIIPTRTVLELVKIINDEDKDIEIHIFTNKIVFKFDNIEFLTKLINGSFPDTSKLIPETFEIEAQVKYDDLYSAIDRASLLSSGDDKNTILFELKGDTVKISSNIPEIGMIEETFNTSNKSNKSISISFSSKFMTDALRAINSEEVLLKLNGDVKPIIITSTKNSDLTELIVPIRTY